MATEPDAVTEHIQKQVTALDTAIQQAAFNTLALATQRVGLAQQLTNHLAAQTRTPCTPATEEPTDADTA